MSEAALFGDDEMSAEESALLEQQQSQDAEDKAAAEAEAAEKKAEEPEPEASEEAEQEPAEEKKEGQRVPLSELMEERRARQQAQRELGEFRERYAKLDGRLEELSERFKAPVEQPPSIDDDPVSHIAWQNRELQKQQSEIGDRLDKRDEEAQKVQQWQNFQSAVAADERAYRTANPDQPFDKALEYLRAGRAQEYQAMGIVDPVQQQQLVAQDEVFVIQQAMSQGKSPSQAAWDLAVARGYKPAEPSQSPAEVNEGARKIENLVKGQKASTSLSSAGGGAEVPLSLEAIAEMSDEEFAKIPESEWRRMMGGE